MWRRFLLSSALLLGACRTHLLPTLDGSPTPTPTAPPHVVSVSPADGATGVAPDAKIVVVFSAPIDASWVGAISLAGPDGPEDGVAAVEGSSLTFSATALDAPGAQRVVTLGAPAEAREWTFALRGERAWTPPERFATDGEDPRVLLDGRGRVYAVWRSGTRILASCWRGAAGWEPATTLDAGADGARDPALARDADGTFVAAWANGARIVTARFDGTRWGPATTLQSDTKRLADTRLATTSVGIVAAWVRAGGTVWATGPGLSAPLQISSLGRLAFAPRLAAVPGGAVAVWRESDGVHAWVVAATLAAGAWGAPQRLSIDTGADAYEPEVAALGPGALVAWSQRTKPDSRPAPSIVVARFDGGTWSGAETIADPVVTGAADTSGAGTGGDTAPRVVPDGAGGAWIFWRERDGVTLSANNLGALRVIRVSGTGDTEDEPATIDDGTHGAPALPAVAVAASGGLLAFRRGVGVGASVVLAARSGDGWAAPAVVSPGGLEPAVAADGGRAVLVWRATDGSLVASRFD